MRHHVRLRPSEFIFRYGPGSLVSTSGGTGVVPLPEAVLDDGRRAAEHIVEELEKGPNNRLDITPLTSVELHNFARKGMVLGKDLRVYEVPPDDDSTDGVWLGIPFPGYFMCTNYDGHGEKCGNAAVLFRPGKLRGRELPPRCPVCGRNTEVTQIRFIQICNEGHMDDVDWYGLVHRDGKCTRGDGYPEYYCWSGGGILSSITIRCPYCGSKSRLSDAYEGEGLTCTGRRPEDPQERPVGGRGSGHRAQIVQRGSSRVRVPVILTLLVMPPAATVLHRMLRDAYDVIDPMLRGEEVLNSRSLEQAIDYINKNPYFSDKHQELLSWYRANGHALGDDEIARAWKDVKAYKENQGPSPSYGKIIDSEFDVLLKISREGYPPGGTRSETLLEVRPNDARTISVDERTFTVVPLRRVTALTVQLGYMRLASPEAAERPRMMSSCSSIDEKGRGKHHWCPGMRQPGEGLFVVPGDPQEGGVFNACDGVPDSGPCTEWRAVHGRSGDYPEYLFRDPSSRIETTPLFVWWHTFSHMLLREISLDAGYSMSSIHERIYAIPGDDPGSGKAGILLYTHQSGSEGTLGGLISLALHEESMKSYIGNALSRAHLCSNDPVCSGTSVKPPSFNGAACYACAFLPETACGHRNAWLDRRLLWRRRPA